jgi:hypothetical protein
MKTIVSNPLKFLGKYMLHHPADKGQSIYFPLYSPSCCIEHGLYGKIDYKIKRKKLRKSFPS